MRPTLVPLDHKAKMGQQAGQLVRLGRPVLEVIQDQLVYLVLLPTLVPQAHKARLVHKVHMDRLDTQDQQAGQLEPMALLVQQAHKD
jgi:hypothetical protein